MILYLLIFVLSNIHAMRRVNYIHLYDEPSSKTLDMNAVGAYVRSVVKCDVDCRKEFFAHFLRNENIDRVVDKIVCAEVLDPRKKLTKHTPASREREFEKQILSDPEKRTFGILYDGFVLQQILDELIPKEENNLEHLHVAFTNRLVCTFDESDYRYHYRTIICGYPSIICTSGIVEAPAKPRDFYYLQLYYASIGNTNLDDVKRKFHGRFIDYNDPRFTDVVNGFVLQALFYQLTGNPFCKKSECRLFNAHWQEDLIKCQLNNSNLCDNHLKILHNFNIMKP